MIVYTLKCENSHGLRMVHLDVVLRHLGCRWQDRLPRMRFHQNRKSTNGAVGVRRQRKPIRPLSIDGRSPVLRAGLRWRLRTAMMGA